MISLGGYDWEYGEDGSLYPIGPTGAAPAAAPTQAAPSTPGVSYVIPAAPELGVFASKEEAQAAMPGAMVISSGFTSGDRGSDNATTWTSLSGSPIGPNGAPPADANVSAWQRPTGDEGTLGTFLSGPIPTIAASMAGGYYGAGAAADAGIATEAGNMWGPGLAEGAGNGFQTLSGNAVNTVTPQVAGWSTEAPMLEAGLQPSGAMTYPVSSVAPVGAGYAIPAAATGAAAGGISGPIATGAATAAGGAALGGGGASGSSPTTSNDTPGEATIAPGVVNPSGIETGMNGAVGSGLGGAAATGAASAGSAAALQRILAGGGTAADYASILGAAAPGLLGAYASNQQTNAYTDLANKQLAYGEPSRARFEASMAPGFDPNAIPGYSAALDNSANAILRKLSATSGNPYGSPGALIEANKAVVSGTALPAIQQYQLLNSQSGGLSSMTPAANANQSAAIGSQGNLYNSLGAAAANVTAPPAFNLADYMRQLTGGTANALT